MVTICRDTSRRVFTVGITFFMVAVAHAQNLDKIGKKEMVTINGAMNYNTVMYDAFGMEDRRDPFAWYFNGNLNISILDVNLPFTFSYSNHHGTYTQPFNMQSCSPKYKWAQAHIGTTAMNFSNYTLAGHLFTGGGIELRPQKIVCGAMYGRLLKAVEYDPSSNGYENMSFRRMGEAIRIGYEDGGNEIGATWFRAWDESSSLLFIPGDADLYPEENVAISMNGKTTLFSHLTVESELAISGITNNVNSLEESMDFSGLEKWMMRTRTTTEFFRAWKITVGYSSKNISIRLNHEHVDPDYRTFGAYYFNNDLENFTLAPSFRLFGGKLSIALNGGVQRNNLDGNKLSTMHRLVGSANISCMPAKKFSISAAYSDFTTFTNRRPQTDPFQYYLPSDTLLFFQVSQQGNGTVMYSFGSGNSKSTIVLNSSCQVSQQKQLLNSSPAIKVVNGNVSYNLQLVNSKTTFTALANYNHSAVDTIITEFIGPGLQTSKTCLQGTLRISAGAVYNRNYTAWSQSGRKLANHILSSKMQLTYAPKIQNKKYGKPTVSISANYLDTFPVNGNSNKGELTVMGNLGYGF